MGDPGRPRTHPMRRLRVLALAGFLLPSLASSQDLAAIGSKRTTMTAGTVLDLGGGATLTCLCVNGAAIGGGSVPVAGTSQEENSRSIALKLSYGNYQEAICGDLTGGGSSSAN